MRKEDDRTLEQRLLFEAMMHESESEGEGAKLPPKGALCSWSLRENLKVEVMEIYWVLFPDGKKPSEVFLEVGLYQGKKPLTSKPAVSFSSSSFPFFP